MCCMFYVFARSRTLQTELIFLLLLMSEITSILLNVHANCRDQEHLRLKIEQWKQDNSNSLYFYRPLINAEDHSSTSENDNQTLLFVHQEAWQQDLLSRYGNTISLMDATYKTTKYEVALFFVTVKTNVGYCVVAEFVVQSETKENISEALSIVLSWNPKWNPPYFMTDYSEAEIGAIETTFPSCKVYICDFHREQCWERWVKERKHGLTTNDADIPQRHS